MSLEIEAVYEDGVLKPAQPLPLKEHERVTVSVKPQEQPQKKSQTSRIRQSAGLLRWTGDPEVLCKIAEDPEFGVSHAP